MLKDLKELKDKMTPLECVQEILDSLDSLYTEEVTPGIRRLPEELRAFSGPLSVICENAIILKKKLSSGLASRTLNTSLKYLNSIYTSTIEEPAGKDIFVEYSETDKRIITSMHGMPELIESSEDWINKKLEKGDVLIAKEDCMNNFTKGQEVLVTNFSDINEVVLDDIARLSVDLVIKYFWLKSK